MEIKTGGLIYHKIAKLELGVTYYGDSRYFILNKEKMKLVNIHTYQLFFESIEDKIKCSIDEIVDNKSYYIYWIEVNSIAFNQLYDHKSSLYCQLKKMFKKVEIRFYNYGRIRNHYITKYYKKDLRIFKLNNILNV